VRATLCIEQVLTVPTALAEDRRARRSARPFLVRTEVSIVAGEPRVDFVTSFVNEQDDHRLRALVHLPYAAERFDVEHTFAVVSRPFDPLQALGAGAERAAPTGPHHLFIDLGAGQDGVALMSRGLLEHEVTRGTETTTLAVTLLRAVGWLARGDLTVVDHAVGPMLPTPAAQERGPHRCEYAILLHGGDWRAGAVLPAARRYAAPPIAINPRGTRRAPIDTPLLTVSPSDVVVTALEPKRDGLTARLLNTAAAPMRARLEPYPRCVAARVVDPLGRELDEPPLEIENNGVSVTLRPWQLITVWFQ
jgi:alpha-mannosidase